MIEPRLITLLVPVLNEEEMIPLFITAAMDELANLNYEILFVNDGSIDNTEQVILSHIESSPRIHLINLSRNFGKEAAMMAGLASARGDAVIPIDVDLQDPLSMIHQLVEQWGQGFDVVLAKRADRRADTWLKRTLSRAFYTTFNRISDFKIPENVGDFRLMDKKVVYEVVQLGESNLFMKGLYAWVGFKTTTLEYERPMRMAGSTNFNTWKLWNFAIEGITSFTAFPLKIWSYLGGSIAITAMLYALFIFVRFIFTGIEVNGYLSVVLSVLIIGGLQLIGLGLIGEYIGRIYTESKKRPQYIIRNEVNHETRKDT